MAPQAATRSRLVSGIAGVGMLGGAVLLLWFEGQVLTDPSVHSALGLLGALGMLLTSLGLKERRERARQAFIAVLAYWTLLSIVTAARKIVPGLSSNATPPEARRLWLEWSAVLVVVEALVILKLRTRRLRQEFDDESTA